ncbi:Hypothetical protein A7982_11461 [Minicystis rosea]|nr:Hypothetical protein A7982_11461 [Minicystis rosea]
MLKICSPNETDYPKFPRVIDITMGEYVFSDFYPVHSDSFATCLGVVIGAVNGFGVCVGHLDPLAGPTGSFYKSSLDAMIKTLLTKGRAAKFDILFFKDGYGAVGKFGLVEYVKTRFKNIVVEIHDRTDAAAKNVRYDEVIAQPSALHSAYVGLHIQGSGASEWDDGRTVMRNQADGGSNLAASNLGRVREIVFDGNDFKSAESRE